MQHLKATLTGLQQGCNKVQVKVFLIGFTLFMLTDGLYVILTSI